MRAPATFWATFATIGTAVELWAISHDRVDWTISRSARRVLHCHTPTGRAATLLFIGSGSAWLANHLLNIPTD